MPKQIIKPSRDEDFYVEWSSIVEAPTFWGCRADLLNHLIDDYRPGSDRIERERETARRRIERADATGSSAYAPFGCTWDVFGEIYEQRGILPRANLRALCHRLTANADDDVTDLLTPFDDEIPAG